MQTNNKTNHYLYLLISALIVLSSCTEKFWPNLNDKYDRLLVVDGKITNEPGPYTIKLSTSSPIESGEYSPLVNAKVLIIDNQGNSELLNENEPGIYQTDPNGIQGIIGNQYKISIETNGKLYESEFEELKNAVGIESIDASWEKRTTSNSVTDEYGFQFYVSTETAEEPINFFYWEISETYHYQSLYLIYSIYWGEGNLGKNGFERLLTNTDSLKNCWLTQDVRERFTYTTKNLTSPKINQLPINFTSNGIKFRFKYALQVKQYNISENAYAFLNSLEEQNDIEGSLYTAQPYQILGNVRNINDPDEAVLGYFLTASVSISQPVLLKRPLGYNTPINYGSCSSISGDNTFNVLERVRYMPSSRWPIIIAENPRGETAEPMIVERECVDCTTQGGISIKPTYWDNDLFLITPNDQFK